MYSGTTFRNASGNFAGAHQKIDKVARRHLSKVLPPGIAFPKSRDILHFEGKNGPDGIKRKSPAKDEPWHYYDPTDPTDTELLQMIEGHSHNLTRALAEDNYERAAFEAAWLAHAIVDGLTPAHHYPLEEKLEELRGQGLETRTTMKEKLVVRQTGDTRRQILSKNWQVWGAKGIMTTHFLFELGIATAIAPLSIDTGKPNANERIRVERDGIVPFFKEAALSVYALDMYHTFHKRGWTPTLARATKQALAPVIVKTVALAWFDAALKAAVIKERRVKAKLRATV